MSIVIVPSLDQRRKEWFENLATDLEDLKEKFKDIELEKLSESENFTDAFMHSYVSAMRTHHQEKLEALRNTVLNTITPNAPDEDLQLIFINYIDRHTLA
jgi:hypothetical protein